MKRILFSDHALDKIELLKKHSIFVEIELIEKTVKTPDSTNKGYGNRLVAQSSLDENHVLRVIYEESDDEIRIITIYPARRKRYEED